LGKTEVEVAREGEADDAGTVDNDEKDEDKDDGEIAKAGLSI